MRVTKLGFQRHHYYDNEILEAEVASPDAIPVAPEDACSAFPEGEIGVIAKSRCSTMLDMQMKLS